jgi:hypothetical protein
MGGYRRAVSLSRTGSRGVHASQSSGTLVCAWPPHTALLSAPMHTVNLQSRTARLPKHTLSTRAVQACLGWGSRNNRSRHSSRRRPLGTLSSQRRGAGSRIRVRTSICHPPITVTKPHLCQTTSYAFMRPLRARPRSSSHLFFREAGEDPRLGDSCMRVAGMMQTSRPGASVEVRRGRVW